MEAKLIVVSGKTNRGEVALKLPSTIGRSRQATLTVAHPMISRQHCEIYERDGLLMLRDLGSLNGVLLDGKRVTEAPLPPGTEFVVGPLTLRVEYQYSGDLSALPPIQEHTEAATAEDTAPPAAVADTTDLPATSFEETVPVEEPAAVEETASMEQPAAVEPDADEMGFSFMDESPAATAAAEEPLEFEMTDEDENAPATEAETMQSEPAADAETVDFETAAESQTMQFEPAAETETAEFEAVAESETAHSAAAGEDATPEFEAVAEEPTGEMDFSSQTPAGKQDTKKKAGGWWPFAGKGAEKESKAVKKSSPAKPAAPAKTAKKTETPPAKKPAEAAVDFDELAFEALQDEPEAAAQQPAAAKKAPAKPDEEDIDSFLQGLE